MIARRRLAFTEFWGQNVNLAVIDEIAAPDMFLQYSLHEPRRGRADIRAFMTDFRAAFPDLNFWGTRNSLPRETMSPAGGKAAARIPERPSMTSCGATKPFLPRPGARCVSPARRS